MLKKNDLFISKMKNRKNLNFSTKNVITYKL